MWGVQTLKKTKKNERGFLYGVPISLEDLHGCMVSSGVYMQLCTYMCVSLRASECVTWGKLLNLGCTAKKWPTGTEYSSLDPKPKFLTTVFFYCS